MVMGIFVIVPKLRKHVVINSDVNCNPGLKSGIEIECSLIRGCRNVLLNHVNSACCDCQSQALAFLHLLHNSFPWNLISF